MNRIETSAQLRPAIADHISRYVRRTRRLRLLGAVCHAMLLAMLWLLTWAVADRFLEIPAGARILLLVALIALIISVIRRPLLARFSRRIDLRRAAEEIDRKDGRFGERLATAVSRSIDPRNVEGSPQLVERITAEVESLIRQRPDVRSLVPLRPTLIRLIGCAVAISIFAGLGSWRWLGLPTLIARQIVPFASVSPVTTTHLSVEPGSMSLVQGEPLTIAARAEPLFGGSVILRTSSDAGQSWTSVGMTPANDGGFTQTLASLSRDLIYQVSAGDATSALYQIRILRRPILREFRIRLNYPDWVGRQSLTLSSTDGVFDAPAGTQANITAVASEPLAGATLTINGQTISMQATSDPRSRQATITVSADATWQLEMTSARHVTGSGPPDMTIRAVPDRPPVARLLVPEDASFLRPGDSIRIPYQAADDYGLSSLEARIDINQKPLRRQPLAIGSDPRRCEDTWSLKLADLQVGIGDVVTVTLAATDRAGQTSLAAPCAIVIAPEAVGPDERRRVNDLLQATRIAAIVGGDLDDSQRLVDQRGRLAAKLAGASDSAAMLVRTLLGAGSGLTAQDRDAAYASLADAAQVQSFTLESLSTDAAVAAPAQLRERLTDAYAAGGRLQTLLEQIAEGRLSRMLLAERRNLASLGESSSRPGIVSLREDVDAAVRRLGLNPLAEAAPDQLRSRAEAAERALGAAMPPDLVDLMSRWSESDSTDQAASLLASRLLTAAQMESVRGDTDPAWANDLQIAARAVRSTALRLPATRPAADPRRPLAAAFALLARQHLLRQQNAVEPAELRDGAGAARQALRSWAGDAEVAAVVPTMPASAVAPAASQPIATTNGSGLAGQTSRSPSANAAANLESDARQVALNAIRDAQEELTDLPQQLGRLDESVAWFKLAAEQADQAQRLADSAAADQQPTARRAAELARSQAEDAFEELQQVSQDVEIERVIELARDMHGSLLETATAFGSIDTQLVPVLARLHARIAARDAVGAAQAIVEARAAVAGVQEALRQARQSLLERDPLVAARWFTQRTSIAQATTRQGAAGATSAPSLPGSVAAGAGGAASQPSSQQAIDPLLSSRRGWDDAFRNAGPQLIAPEWGRSRPWRQQDLNVAARRADPPGYEESLRIYFQVLGEPEREEKP